MLIRAISFIKTERQYFSERIVDNARRVIYSDIAHTFSSPLTDIFLGAFIWRNTGSLLSVLFYKIGEWIFLPIVFYYNSHLLKKTNVQQAFAIGTILSGLTPLVLITLGATSNWAIFFYGCLYGIGNGFYWANRNYLEFKETLAESRNYFFSLLSSVSGISKILVPLFAGWFIFFSGKSGWYTPNQAYWVIFFISFLLLIICASFVWSGNFSNLSFDKLRVRLNVLWSPRRILFFTHGFIDGIGFISGLLLLYVFGDERALGTALSIAAVCVIAVTYIYGRLAREQQEYSALRYVALFFLIATIALISLPRGIAVAVYVVIMSINSKFSLITSQTIGLRLADKEAANFIISPYGFIIDNELFLNAGRLIGAGLIAIFTIIGSQSISLFYGPLVIAVIYTSLIFFFLKNQYDKQ